MNQARKHFSVSPALYKPSTETRSISNTSNPVMESANYGYNPLSTLPAKLLNSPAYNGFNVAFGFASQPNYPAPPNGPVSPSYSHPYDGAHYHDDTTCDDESGEFQPTTSSKPRTMETRKRKPGSRKSIQPQEQILKRRVQNRAAQRSFRERQKEYVHDLEHQVEQLKGEVTKLHEYNTELQKAVSVGTRIPQLWNSPAMTEEIDFIEVDDIEPVKMEDMWPVEYQGMRYV